MNTFPRVASTLLLLAAASPFAIVSVARAQDLTVQVQKADRKLLSVGDPAPKLEIGNWVRGEAVKEFSKGKAYVVEFGATWCPPCRASIPHLSEMQKKYEGKVIVTSVHVWENRSGTEQPSAILAKVTESYKQFDPPVAHRVALDTETQAMAANWLGAAGLNSIPQAMVVVVDDAGPKIAWIGHPMSPQFDEIVQKAADGKIDMKEEGRKAAEENARKAKYERTMGLVQQVMGGTDTAAGLAALDAALKGETDANYRSSYLRSKFNLLAKSDEPGAYALVRGLLDGEFKNSENELGMFCDLLTSSPSLKAPDTKLAVALGERASTLGNAKNPRVLHSLAGAYALDKQFDKAIATEEAAMAAYTEMLGEEKAAVMVSMLKARIDEWKKSKN